MKTKKNLNPVATGSGQPETDRLLTVSEAAQLSSVSTQTIGRYIREGKITAVNLGPKMLRIRHSELQRFWGKA